MGAGNELKLFDASHLSCDERLLLIREANVKTKSES